MNKDMEIMRWYLIATMIVSFLLLSAVLACADVAIDMNIISWIESSDNPKAFNEHSYARGAFQITPICLDDYNQYHSVKYTPNALYIPYIGYEVADWYMNVRIPQLLDHYGYEDTLRNRLISWNCGIMCLKRDRLPRETINFIKKYKARR